MNYTSCCVCFKANASIPLSVSDSNNETLTSKLQKVVSEVPWKDTFTICPECLNTLNIVLEFRSTCIKSSSIRLKEEPEPINECGFKRCISSSEKEIELIENFIEGHSEIAVTSEITKIELNSNDQLYTHKEIHHSEHSYRDNLLCVDVNDKKQNCLNNYIYFCDKCKHSFVFKSQYEEHIRNHNVFICFHCDKPFKSKVMLAKHIKVKHDVQSTITKFELQSLDENLLEKKSKLFQCNKCKKIYKTQKFMLNHMVTCDGVMRHSKINFIKDFFKNECEKCGRYYSTQKILRAHLKQCKTKKISQEQRCHLCDELLKSSEEKFEHILNEHNINLKIDYTCQFCYKQFLSDESLQSHMKENHENQLIQREELKNYAERSYSCEVCSKVFGYVKEVIEHCIEEHQMDAKSVKPYLCDKCNTRFMNSTNLIQHKQYHQGERSHICSFCGKSFITKSDLTVHEYTHLNRRNYKCEICQRAFNTNKNLRSHMLVVHTDSSLWKYQCNLCAKKFPLKSGFDQHMRRHSGDKRFKCLICEKSFISSSELKKHNTFHSNERAHKCSHCGKEYKDRRVYEIHLTKVHGLGNAKIPVRMRKFACHICTGTFFDKQKLSRHMCTHTGIKPYVCTICEKKFSDKSYLKYHLKIVHNSFDFPTNKVSDITNEHI